MTFKTKEREAKIDEIMQDRSEAEHVLNLLDYGYIEIERLKARIQAMEQMQDLNAQIKNAAGSSLADLSDLAAGEKYILVDLERVFTSGGGFMWKQGARGYTLDPAEAHRYTAHIARKKILGDYDGRTVAISEKNLKNIFR